MKNVFQKVLYFYVDGFKHMTTGKWLWAIILVKLFVLFVVLRWLFFPNFLGTYHTDAEKSHYVGSELINRAVPSADATSVSSKKETINHE